MSGKGLGLGLGLAMMKIPVYIPPGLTLNILMARTKSLMGGKILSYSARDNDCGHFVMAILQANNLAISQNIIFVEETTAHLYTGQLRKITNTITDIAAGVDIIKTGR
jgi:hypothetical protein